MGVAKNIQSQKLFSLFNICWNSGDIFDLQIGDIFLGYFMMNLCADNSTRNQILFPCDYKALEILLESQKFSS